MKTILKVLVGLAVVFYLIGSVTSEDSHPNAGQSHTEIQRTLKNAIEANSKYPNTVSLKEYDFVSLGGNVGVASFSFTAKNAFGIDVPGTATVTVVLNSDLTINELKQIDINQF